MTIPINDTHAIPPNDEPVRDPSADYSAFMELNPMLSEVFVDANGRRYFTVALGDETLLIDREFVYNDPDVVIAQVGSLTRVYPASVPAKTHDLSVRRGFGNVVVGVENGEDRRTVYLQEGVAQDLGRVLAPLTPAQRQLLIDDLTGGGK